MRRTLPALAVLFAASALSAAGPGVGPAYEQEPFGQVPAPPAKDGKGKKGMVPITAYTLINKNGLKAKIIDYGGIVTQLHAPDKDGKFADVVLGFDTLDGYLKGHPYFGANVGRSANRIANAKFSLDGKEYKLFPNNEPHTLHGGKEGFDKKVWRAKADVGPTGPTLTLLYESPNGEEGYPGRLSVQVLYTLTNANELRVDYSATTDKPTLCNLAHHSYFNLAGHNSGDILGHEAQFAAANYTPADETLIPTGKIAPVAGTPFDFTKPKPIGKDLKAAGGKPIGYDLNYVLDVYGKGAKVETDDGRIVPAGGAPVLAARVTEPTSGRVLEVWTTEPGLQFYSGNFLDGTNVGKGGAVYKQYHGFCLEPQKFPDSINKPDWWKTSNPVLRPGQEYRQTTIYKFGVKK